MRDAEPGMFEYELEAAAEYVYKRGGAYGESYFPLIANGRNMPYTHYHKNRDRLRDGDLVQFDWAPDLANYTSDVTRVFPADGRFTPRQREFYVIYLRLYQALMTSIRVHATAREIMDAAVVKMDTIMTEYKFTDPKIRETAEAFVNRYRANPKAPRTAGPRSLGHSVGMEVHDVRNPTDDPRARVHLHHRAADDHGGRRTVGTARGHDPHHRDGLREPVGLRARGGRRHRETHGPARPRRAPVEAAALQKPCSTKGESVYCTGRMPANGSWYSGGVSSSPSELVVR